MLYARLNYIDIVREFKLASVCYYIDMTTEILSCFKTGCIVRILYGKLS